MSSNLFLMIGKTVYILSFCLLATSVKIDIDAMSWQRPRLPDVFPVTEVVKGRAEYQGHVHSTLRVDCDLDCQIEKGKQSVSVADIENELSYETLVVSQQLRISSSISVSNVPDEILRLNNTSFGRESSSRGLNRKKRSIFGYDTRYTLPTTKYSTLFPFSTAVKVSTGCAGVLISPKHVLTSAHCIHNGKKYLKGVKKLRVGRFFERKIKIKKRPKKNKKTKKRRKQKRIFQAKVPTNDTVLSRTKRSVIKKRKPKFRWTRALKTRIPQSWMERRKRNLMVEYDYAVIELKKPIGKHFMKLGISPVKDRLPRNQRVHFTAFDQTKPVKLLYRNCPVEEQSTEMMYNYCDAEKGTSGAGIYIRLYDRDARRWDRRVIGVFSGHQWVDMGDKEPPKEYNTGVRITPLKYAQICYWTTGDYSLCRDD